MGAGGLLSVSEESLTCIISPVVLSVHNFWDNRTFLGGVGSVSGGGEGLCWSTSSGNVILICTNQSPFFTVDGEVLLLVTVKHISLWCEQ